MRQVDRSSVPVPKSLKNAKPPAVTPSYSVYRHPEVVKILRDLYIDKCYLCEAQIYHVGEVEHFHPWHESEPQRAYDWHNLHWSCRSCNSRKRKRKYKKMCDDSQAPLTLLIDPSNPPYDCKVEELITFSKRGLEAKGIGDQKFKLLVGKTVDFLKERPKEDRHIRYDEMLEAVAVLATT